MPMFEDRGDGVVESLEYGPGCDDCFGLGAVFCHVPSCESDFCAGNGDEHACGGSWLPCDSCGSIEVIR